MTTTELTTIERTILIRAPRSCVWHSLTTPQDFSKWFSADVHGDFTPGKRVDMTSRHPCSADPRFYMIIERMEPEHTFSWRWHPGSAKAEEDGSTVVEFQLEEVDGATRVTVTESGFDGISLGRRAKAFGENSHGWEIQLDSLAQYASKTD